MAKTRKTQKGQKEIKKRIFDIIQIGTRVDIPSTIFDYFIVCMILISISVTFLQTFEELMPFQKMLDRIEFFTINIFIIEYSLRLYTSDLLYPDTPKMKALNKFIFSFYGIIDMLSILSYFSALYSNGIIALRMIRAVRILRLFKVNKTIDAFNVVGEVLKEKKNQILSSLFMIAMLILGSSLCMYGFEHEAQPEVFENAFSGIWWALSAVLTIGYGDIYPITIGGQIVAILISLLGVCAVAVPTGVISAGFVEYYTKLNRKEGKLTIPEDLNRLLQVQASKAGLDTDLYLEKMILEKEVERKEKNQNTKRR